MCKISKFIAAIACGLAMGVGGNAHATDGKTYPGEMCLKWSGAGTPSYAFGGIYNTSTTQTLSIDCPIVRDSMGFSVQGAAFRALDQNTQSDVSCILYSVWYLTTTTFNIESSGPASHTDNYSGSYQTVSVPGIPSVSQAHDYLSCSIPPSSANGNSGIATYQVNENN